MQALCIDIDNVIGQTDQVMRQVIRDYTGGRVCLEYAHIKKFNYQDCRDAKRRRITKKDWARVHDLFSEPRYLWLIQPFDGVQGHLQRLSKRYELHLATSRLPKARRTTVEWLENHSIPLHDLHFLRSGQKHVSLGKFFAAVEDHYEQAVLFAGAGTPCYLIKHPWNMGCAPVDDVHWVKDWAALADQLLP
jgi:uncharacterized HAD superfamily protein